MVNQRSVGKLINSFSDQAAIAKWIPGLANNLLEPVTNIGSFLLLGAITILLIITLPQLI